MAEAKTGVDSIAADAAGVGVDSIAAGAAGRAPRADEGALRLVLLGAPGSGKGTQAELLAARLGVPAISTGNVLREAVAAGTELGRRVHAIMSEGRLVDDATMAEVVRERLSQPDAARGFLLDGYPRTRAQAEALEALLAGRGQDLDAVVLIEVPEAALFARLAGRGRPDDARDVVRARLTVYEEANPALVGYYGERGLLRTIDGDQAIDRVTSDILAALGVAR